MSRLKVCGNICYNLIYDNWAITKAVNYLRENNPTTNITWKDIYDNMVSAAEKMLWLQRNIDMASISLGRPRILEQLDI